MQSTRPAPSRIARRDSVEESIVGRLSVRAGTGISGLCLHGRPGNGKRTLATSRLPQLFPGRVRVLRAGELLQTEHLTEPIVVVPDTSMLPERMPDPLPAGQLVVVCERLTELPGWLLRLVGTASFGALEIRELALTELQHYVSTALGGRVSLQAAAELGRLSGGVPAALSALIRAARSSGVLVDAGGAWELMGEVGPELLRLDAERLVAGLSDHDRSIVERVALVEPVDPSGLTGDARSVTDEWIEHGLLIRDERGISFRVPAIAEAVRSLTQEDVAGSVYREQVRSATVPTVQAVRWAVANHVALDTDVMFRVLDDARSRRDWPSIVRFTSAWETAAGDDAGLRARMLVERASAWRFHGYGDGDEAEHDLALAEELCALLDDSAESDELRAAVAAQHADVLHYHRGDPVGGIGVLDLAFERISSGNARGELAAQRVMHLVYSGRHTEALAAWDDRRSALARAPIAARTRAQIACCISLCAIGRPARALRQAYSLMVREGLGISGATWSREELRAALFFCWMHSKGPQRSPSIVAHVETTSEPGYVPDEAVFALSTAWWLLLEGNAIEASALAKLALATAEHRDPSGFMEAVLSTGAEAAAFGGDEHAARESLRRAAAVRPRTSASIDGGSQAARLAARYALGEQRVTADVVAIGRRFAAAGLIGWAAQVWHVGVRFGAKDAARELAGLDGELDGDVNAVRLSHAAALLADDPIQLYEVGRVFERQDMLVYAAEAFAQSESRAADAGLETLAQKASRTLQQVLQRCALSTHPGLRSALDRFAPPSLTRREREMLELIERGLSNKEIAHHLRISGRTVEGHIARLYRKIGATRRGRARDVVRADDAADRVSDGRDLGGPADSDREEERGPVLPRSGR